MIIAYLIWKGSYNTEEQETIALGIIAYLIWKGSYNTNIDNATDFTNYSISDLERKL